jgi:uncharacterized protein (TIGR00299 family) protein
MKTLYLECAMGAAGDMLMGALLELHPDPAGFLQRLNALGIPGVTVSAQRKETQGILGTHMEVLVHGQEELHHHHDHEHEHDHDHDHEHHHDHDHEHHHHHAAPADIAHLIGDHLPLPEPVKAHALAVYDSIAQAEARAHGKPVTEIHFHEVGTLDAVADVVGVCWLMEELGAEKICASPVHVGSGHVHCAHGVLPVPAPATAYLLEGIPSYGGEIDGELCTPTGAALLRHFVTEFGPQPAMKVEKIGYGVGSKEFPRANCLRAMLGEGAAQPDWEEIYDLSCNIDDMTAEDLAYGMEVLRDQGALEVYAAPVTMKKGRPGTVITCICRAPDRQRLAALMFRHFSTLGIRETALHRYVLQRETRLQQTALGPVQVKTAAGWGATKSKPEFEDLRKIAESTGKSLSEIRKEIAKETEI